MIDDVVGVGEHGRVIPVLVMTLMSPAEVENCEKKMSQYDEMWTSVCPAVQKKIEMCLR